MVDRMREVVQAARGQRIRSGSPAEAEREARAAQRKLAPESELSIDDSDFGTDPYNRTGRFTVLETE